MTDHIYSTLFKTQERKSDRSKEIEQRKESQNTHTHTHTHTKQGHVTLIYCINIKLPSSVKGFEKYIIIFKYLIIFLKCQPRRTRMLDYIGSFHLRGSSCITG